MRKGINEMETKMIKFEVDEEVFGGILVDGGHILVIPGCSQLDVIAVIKELVAKIGILFDIFNSHKELVAVCAFSHSGNDISNILGCAL